MEMKDIKITMLHWKSSAVNFGSFKPMDSPEIAYLSDTLAWKDYCDDTIADYAVGGPSAQMLVLVGNLMFETKNDQGLYNKMIIPYRSRGICIY